jgi:N-acetylmuramic acid 6-phosphate etherase
VAELTGRDPAGVKALLEAAGGEVKTAVVCGCREVTPEAARRMLAAAGGRLGEALAGEPPGPDPGA